METSGRLRVATVSVLVVALVGSVALLAGKDAHSRTSLLSWSNANDDGAGVLGGQQHGVTRTIWSCDPDDPSCDFDISHNGYMQGKWKKVDINKVGRVQVCNPSIFDLPDTPALAICMRACDVIAGRMTYAVAGGEAEAFLLGR